MTIETFQRDKCVDAFPDGKLAHSIEAFADLADLGRSSVYQAIKNGSLVARKNGKRTLITASDGMRWLRSLPVANSDAA